MKNELLKVAIRQQAVFVSEKKIQISEKKISYTSAEFVTNLRKLGYTVTEELLGTIDKLASEELIEIFDMLKGVLGVALNWAPLVKGWDIPTNESVIDHLITFYVNILECDSGSRLQCGHLIPTNTFPLERYNGCPFCGTPFQFATIENYGQGCMLKVLELWTEKELAEYLKSLLESRTALDATQTESLKTLLKALPLPEAIIKMKETKILVIDLLIEMGEADKAHIYISTPTDILRYLWYKHTGFLQIVEPKTILMRSKKNNKHISSYLYRTEKAKRIGRYELKLKYNREKCRIVANWLNNLNMSIEKACEIMHPKRSMWVRFIRALRLAEYAKKPGYNYLKELMDTFYNQSYTVFQGVVESYRLKADPKNTFALLKQRPGLFARSLFANMLLFGAKKTLKAFEGVLPQVPTRLILTLNMYADSYFSPKQKRIAKTLGGNNKSNSSNRLLDNYSKKQLDKMVSEIGVLCLKSIYHRFCRMETTSKTMFIAPELYDIPLSIGDRSETVQDISGAPMGACFHVEGNAVRLFMQWGKGLDEQRLDMDLSCYIIYKEKTHHCSYSNLSTVGAKHSGDIRSIPDMVGTAEYIELDMNELKDYGAKYVIFTCNAYSVGAISPNLVVGWMNSANPMKISESSGVAYDPSCVQHQVRVRESLSKGLAFGVLDVASSEIFWLELSFGGKTIHSLNYESIFNLLKKLKSKTSIGEFLKMKAKAQRIKIVNADNADDVYTLRWALDSAAVTKLFAD